MAIYFLLCLRLTYFAEWKYRTDVKNVYDAVACYHHSYGITEVFVSWYYAGATSFCRVLSGHEPLLHFTYNSLTPPAGKQMYVLHSLFERQFIEAQGLRVVYRGESTDVVVAARPEFQNLSPGQCSTIAFP